MYPTDYRMFTPGGCDYRTGWEALGGERKLTYREKELQDRGRELETELWAETCYDNSCLRRDKAAQDYADGKISFERFDGISAITDQRRAEYLELFIAHHDCECDGHETVACHTCKAHDELRDLLEMAE